MASVRIYDMFMGDNGWMDGWMRQCNGCRIQHYFRLWNGIWDVATIESIVESTLLEIQTLVRLQYLYDVANTSRQCRTFYDTALPTLPTTSAHVLTRPPLSRTSSDTHIQHFHANTRFSSLSFEFIAGFIPTSSSGRSSCPHQLRQGQRQARRHCRHCWSQPCKFLFRTAPPWLMSNR